MSVTLRLDGHTVIVDRGKVTPESPEDPMAAVAAWSVETNAIFLAFAPWVDAYYPSIDVAVATVAVDRLGARIVSIDDLESEEGKVY